MGFKGVRGSFRNFQDGLEAMLISESIKGALVVSYEVSGVYEIFLPGV